MYGGVARSSTTIRFDGSSGGSISFNGVTLKSFTDIKHYNINVIYTSDPVTAYPSGLTTASTPSQTGTFLYGGDSAQYTAAGVQPPTGVGTSPYINELDNFFANSLYATYSVEGAGVTSASGKYVVAPGVTIDPSGTITVTNTAPVLTPLTITATDPQDHIAKITQLFGFLDAPIRVVPDGTTTTIGLIPPLSSSNIISGGTALTLIGEPQSALTISQTGNTLTNQSQTYGSNLIVSAAGGATAYGDFQTIAFTAQGKDNGALSGGDNVSGQITDNQFNFAANAFDVTNGTVYGVAQTLSITGQGGSNASLTGSHDGAAIGNVNNNTLTFGPQTIYGSGYLYGDLQEMTISSQAGSGGTSSGAGGLNISGHVDNNTFTFNPVQVIAYGATGAVYGNLQNLSLNASAAASAGADPNVTASATFSGNAFTFASNTVSGSGVLYGNIQTITLNGSSENASIQSNSFSFGENHVTGGTYGTYVNGVDTLTPNAGATTLYGNVDKLIMTGADSGIGQIKNNSFTFGNDALTGGSGPNNFYGHLTSFGNTGNPSLYGEKGFYNGVEVTPNNGFLTIKDGNGNTITWGNDTYTGGAGVDAYNFTIVGDDSVTPLPVMQGFDVITNFNLAADRLAFSLTNPLYISLAGGTILTPQAFLSALMVTQTATDATLSFGGKGSITLSGLGTQTITSDALKAALASDISITLADPVSALQNPSSPVMLFGHTADLKTWSGLFNTPYPLAAVVDGITLNQDGTVNFGTSAGIINTTSPTITATDQGNSLTSDTSASNPVRILALDGVLIDQATGTVQGGVEAAVIRGHGNVIIGGGADIEYGAPTSLTGAFHLTDPLPGNYAGAATGGTAFSFGDTTPPSTLNYASKLIYDVAQEPNPVIGDVQNITARVQGLSDTIFNAAGGADGVSSLTGATITMADNHIEVVPASPATNFDTQKTYGNVQNISFDGAGGENAYSVSDSYDDARISYNNLTTGNNTITAPGTIYGTAQNLSLTSTDGFYAVQTPPDSSSPLPHVENRVEMALNHFITGDNTLTGTGAGANILYGDLQSVSLTAVGADTSHQSAAFQAALSGSSGLQIGYGLITGNTFDFGHNALTGGAGTSALYAGIDQLVIMNNEPSLPASTQPYSSYIYSNTFNFQDSALTATGGVTNFHNDINDFSQTNFFNYDVKAETNNGHVQIKDIGGTGAFTPHDGLISDNVITFGNDTMTGSATGVNIFNLDLLSTTDGNIVAEGNTTIQNFGAPGSTHNMLNLELSQALYEEVSNVNGGAQLITADMLGAYIGAHHGGITQTNGDTVISFSDGTNSLGSITLNGVTLSSLQDLGTHLEITANGRTTIDPPSSDANLYNVTIPGDALSSFTQDAHVVDVSSLGHIVDFSGTLDLSLSNALFKTLGLSDANTSAQNLQALENGAHTAAGGVAVTTTTTGAGANAVANTVLTFESTVNGVVNTYGSVTLHDTHFNPADPLNAHLVVTHH
jgi:hypothetical protein